jgi:hypothetical protein
MVVLYFFGYLLHHCCKARRHGRTCSAIAHSSRMETIGDIILQHVEGYSRWMQLTCRAWTLCNCTWTAVFECFSTKVSTISFEFRPKKHLLRLVEARVWGVDRRVRYLRLAWQKIYRNHNCLSTYLVLRWLIYYFKKKYSTHFNTHYWPELLTN